MSDVIELQCVNGINQDKILLNTYTDSNERGILSVRIKSEDGKMLSHIWLDKAQVEQIATLITDHWEEID